MNIHKHPLYRLWVEIKRRCSKPNRINYKYYGGRGIKFFWANDSKGFIEYIEKHLGPKPSGHSIDRIENDGNYEPGNLRWATPKEQINNSNIPIHFIATSPSGNIHHEKNISSFVKRHGLIINCVSACILGKRKTHKGWKFKPDSSFSKPKLFPNIIKINIPVWRGRHLYSTI